MRDFRMLKNTLAYCKRYKMFDETVPKFAGGRRAEIIEYH
jgi:hypothetical protein